MPAGCARWRSAGLRIIHFLSDHGQLHCDTQLVHTFCKMLPNIRDPPFAAGSAWRQSLVWRSAALCQIAGAVCRPEARHDHRPLGFRTGFSLVVRTSSPRWRTTGKSLGHSLCFASILRRARSRCDQGIRSPMREAATSSWIETIANTCPTLSDNDARETSILLAFWCWLRPYIAAFHYPSSATHEFTSPIERPLGATYARSRRAPCARLRSDQAPKLYSPQRGRQRQTTRA
jgi:hypothetical protein